MNCIICNSIPIILYRGLRDRLHPEISGKYTLKQCPDCKLIFIDPQPPEKELLAHYPQTYGIYKQTTKISSKKLLITKFLAKEFFRYRKPKRWLKFFLLPFYFKLSHLPRYVENGNLLDIGCGAGNRMLVFKELGWNVEGLEINQKVAQLASSNTQSKIYVSTLEEANLPEKHFDCVYLNNVFEHMKDPQQALLKIKSTLKHNGELVIVVPNEHSLVFKIFKENWVTLDVPRHLFTYNKLNLSMLLHQHRFIVKKIFFSYIFIPFTSSIAYKLGKSADAFSFLDKFVWIASFFLDPLFNSFAMGDLMTVHSIKIEE